MIKAHDENPALQDSRLTLAVLRSLVSERSNGSVMKPQVISSTARYHPMRT
jgi:hypothetical protein